MWTLRVLAVFSKIYKYTKICAIFCVQLWASALCHLERLLNKDLIARKGRPIRKQVKNYMHYGEARKMADFSLLPYDHYSGLNNPGGELFGKTFYQTSIRDEKHLFYSLGP